MPRIVPDTVGYGRSNAATFTIPSGASGSAVAPVNLGRNYTFLLLRCEDCAGIPARIGKKPELTYRDACAVVSYWGWITRSNSFGFYHKYIKSNVSLSAARKRISSHAKQRARLRANRRIRD